MTTLSAGPATVRTTALRRTRAEELWRGLTSSPPTIASRWLYDENGSRLFEEITRLPEYYPGRRETEILADRAAAIAAQTAATTVLELGAGTSRKTRLLLDAFSAAVPRLEFVPLDVSVEVLLESARAVARDYPRLRVQPVVADFAVELPAFPGRAGERLALFLGGTIGNFDDNDRSVFLHRLRAALAPGDHLLVGADLVKDAERLVAAYDDAAGVTAAFNRNVIAVVARELRADALHSEDFEHIARWNANASRIEMWLRARRDIEAWFDVLAVPWSLRAGAEICTEISVKFRPSEWQQELAAHGFRPIRSWTDVAGDFSLTLARVG